MVLILLAEAITARNLEVSFSRKRGGMAYNRRFRGDIKPLDLEDKPLPGGNLHFLNPGHPFLLSLLHNPSFSRLIRPLRSSS